MATTFTFRGIEPKAGPNYRALVGTIEIARDGVARGSLKPEKRLYEASGQTMTEAAIEHRPVRRSLRVARRAAVAGQARRRVGVRIYIKPFIDWVWGGCFLMALGGFIAVSDRRYRLAVKRKLAMLAGGAAA